MYTIKYVDTVNVNIPMKYLFCVPRAARGENYISYLINIDFMDIDIFLWKSHEKIYDMQLKHWQMSISHFHHELDIFYMCLLSFCSEIKTSCHIETLLILKPKSQKTHLSSVQRVVLIWTQQFCRLRSVV